MTPATTGVGVHPYPLSGLVYTVYVARGGFGALPVDDGGWNGEAVISYYKRGSRRVCFSPFSVAEV